MSNIGIGLAGFQSLTGMGSHFFCGSRDGSDACNRMCNIMMTRDEKMRQMIKANLGISEYVREERKNTLVWRIPLHNTCRRAVFQTFGLLWPTSYYCSLQQYIRGWIWKCFCRMWRDWRISSVFMRFLKSSVMYIMICGRNIWCVRWCENCVD